jgi:hypothetical protein
LGIRCGGPRARELFVGQQAGRTAVDDERHRGNTTSATGIVTSSTTSSGSGENCGNNSDDDGDKQIDCADPDCQEWQCAAPPPMGWSGPFVLAKVASMMTLPDCPASFGKASDADVEPLAPPAECAGCTCGSADVVCSLGATHIFSTSACSSENAQIMPMMAGQCGDFTTIDLDGTRGDVATVMSAKCPPMGGTATLPALTWGARVRSCEPTVVGGGCSNGGTCIAKGGEFRTCISHSEDVPCAAPYTEKILLHGGIDDQRGCTPCDCDPAAGAMCTTAVTELYMGAGCQGTPFHTVIHNNACQGLGAYNAVTGSYKHTAKGTANKCAAKGGMPKGAIVPVMPTTVCCTP